MTVQRTDRLNSLLKEVISEVIRRDVRNPHVTELVTVTRVNISKDLRHAKVFISVIGSEQDKFETIKALNSAAGFIAVNSSHKVVMRFFPELVFKLDDSVDKHMRIEELLNQIGHERDARPKSNEEEDLPPLKENDPDNE
jgi:ribosome-binding factor A